MTTIRSMPRCVIAHGRGHVRLITMAFARATATPAKARGALRTSRRAFRGVRKQYLHLYVTTYEAMVNAKRITSYVIRRMCVTAWSPQTSDT